MISSNISKLNNYKLNSYNTIINKENKKNKTNICEYNRVELPVSMTFSFLSSYHLIRSVVVCQRFGHYLK